ncbi:PREDICTED: phosphoglycerate mutase-like protein 1 [Tarenaya hassleriana]|uniref:phosphoglycerate mutase-like protein 1 n=1 Tax=Tarenaya hassleriana TaxID=28532 RepID=UPI00053C4EEA|nr:PREDICTED: phosphoglycerate mutase-like protein 1 [Tarenaya hassleriana]
MDIYGAQMLPPSLSKLYLLRHAQGIHNVELEEKRETALSPKLFDAELSPKGLQQVKELRKRIHESGLLDKIELVITSPLQRTMQTAMGVFGKDSGKHADEVRRETSTAQHSTVIFPPIMALELCRERMGLYPCDRRKGIGEYMDRFPEIDFSMIENEEDVSWQSEKREDLVEVAARGLQFLKWVLERPEKEIAIVSHGIFLQQTLHAFRNKHGIPFEDKLLTRFANCELRSIEIDKIRVMEAADSLAITSCRNFINPSSNSPSPSSIEAFLN